MKTNRSRLILAALAVTTVAVVIGSLLIGAAPFDLGQVLRVALDRLGFVVEADAQADVVITGIRLPRALATVTVGYGLGTVGAALQGVFRNPLADAHLLGIAPAAGLGSLLGYGLAPAGVNPRLAPVLIVAFGALAGASFALFLGRILQPSHSRNPPAVAGSQGLSLVGTALSFGATAWLGTIVLAWDNAGVPTLMFWIFGGFTGTTWRTLYVVAPVIICCAALLLKKARTLDVLALGEIEARHLGVAVARVQKQILALAGIAVGAAVTMAGVIGFIGLLGPYLSRRVLGPGHRHLLIGSGLVGAILLLLADTGARTIASPTEIPVGLLTGMAGAPAMAWMLLRSQKQGQTG